MHREFITVADRLQETSGFVQRALRDFGLLEAFEAHTDEDQAACVRWVDAAIDDRDQEARVSQLLDFLAHGLPLRFLYSGDSDNCSKTLQFSKMKRFTPR